MQTAAWRQRTRPPGITATGRGQTLLDAGANGLWLLDCRATGAGRLALGVGQDRLDQAVRQADEQLPQHRVVDLALPRQLASAAASAAGST